MRLHHQPSGTAIAALHNAYPAPAKLGPPNKPGSVKPFETNATGFLPTPIPKRAPNAPSLLSPLGVSPEHGPSLQQRIRVVGAALKQSINALPAEVRQGVLSALLTSLERVEMASTRGDISLEEACNAVEMVREMGEALGDIHSQRAKPIESLAPEFGVRRWKLRAPDGDEIVVSARMNGTERGEARISLRHHKDDGLPLKGRHRMMLRIDLERFGTTAVDVQFGSSALDKRIHGLFRNPDGTTFETETGRKLADHHFRGGLPPELTTPSSFASMVRAFIASTESSLNPAEKTP